MTPRLRIAGTRELRRWLGQVSQRAERNVGESVYVAAETIAAAARARAPVATGALKAGIAVMPDHALGAAIVSTAPYSAAVEFGTVKRAARPFLRPALLSSRADVIRLIGRALGRAFAG